MAKLFAQLTAIRLDSLCVSFRFKSFCCLAFFHFGSFVVIVRTTSIDGHNRMRIKRRTKQIKRFSLSFWVHQIILTTTVMTHAHKQAIWYEQTHRWPHSSIPLHHLYIVYTDVMLSNHYCTVWRYKSIISLLLYSIVHLFNFIRAIMPLINIQIAINFHFHFQSNSIEPVWSSIRTPIQPIESIRYDQFSLLYSK